MAVVEKKQPSGQGAHWPLGARLFEPIDGASAVFFRLLFGALLAKWAWDYLEMGRVRKLYIEPLFHFTYYGFDWVQPWPGEGMLWHFVGLLLLALCIATGFLYHLSSLLFALGFTYVFLLDRTNYQNHYYLIGLIAWWLPCLPLNRNVSVDAWLWPAIHTQTVPNWTLGVLRFHIALPYFFGGIAKLHPDWLLGEPLGQMLASQSNLPLLGSYLTIPGLAFALAWAAVLFDLCVVPLLLFRRTRVIAFTFCIVFHLMNSIIFNIHVFPWFMLAATPLFFDPDWPRQVLGGTPLSFPKPVGVASQVSKRRKAALAFCAIYILFHCIWPLRHHVYPGDASWNERGHYFAWRMMLRGKAVVLGYAIHDQATGNVVDGQVNRFLNPEQAERFGRDPEMILHFAHFLGTEYERATGHSSHIHVLALTSLNGRKPELMIDPNQNLLSERRGFASRPWLLPQREPLRYPYFSEPPERWRECVELPKLTFLRSMSQTQNMGSKQEVLTESK